MSYITTYTKTKFDPTNPNMDDILVEDIAHALSLLCRVGGHFRSFHSVGRHCVNCMTEARARGYSEKIQLACLLHNASEVYFSDITRPVKAELSRYRDNEKVLQI